MIRNLLHDYFQTIVLGEKKKRERFTVALGECLAEGLGGGNVNYCRG